MAKQRKQLVIDGKTYQVNNKRQYVNVNNPSDIISRRQAEKIELAQQGVKSFEEKAKQRKALGIPKGFKQKPLTPHSKKTQYYRRFDTITELQESLENLPDETIVYIVAHIVKNYPNIKKNEGESTKDFNARKNLHLQRSVTQSGTPEYLLNRYKFSKIKAQLNQEGYKVNHYEIRFAFIPAK